MRKLAVFASLVLSALASAAPARAADDWAQFRGPTLQGTSDAKGVPLHWDEGQNVKWKTAIHDKGWSSPVVADGQIWLTTASEKGERLFVVCVDLETGKVVHDVKLFDVPSPQFIHPFNSAASPTPAVEDGRVYVTFGSPGTACLDAKTAKVLWERRDFVCNHYRGAGASPILYKDLLILPFDGSDFQFIAAMDKHTGKTVWKTDRSMDYQDQGPDGKPKAEGDMRKAFSTPRIATFDGKTILLSEASKSFYAYDPETGKELWRIENRVAHSGSATPVIGDGLIYFSTGHGKAELWAVRPGGSGVLTDAQIAWKYTDSKAVPTRSSVLLVDDLIYMSQDRGIAACVDAKTGKEVWRTTLKGSYSAAPLYADRRIYFFNEDGKATVIAPGRTFKVLAENQLDAGFFASPAVAGHALILRTRTDLYRIEGGAQ